MHIPQVASLCWALALAAHQAAPPHPLAFVGAVGPNAYTAHIELGAIDPLAQPGLERTLKIKNTSSEGVRVTRLLTSCGCTDLKWNGQPMEGPVTLPAGATAEIGVKMDVYKLHPGAQTKYISILAEGAAQPVATIEVAVTVRALVSFDPPGVTFGRVSYGEARSVTLRANVDPRLLRARPPLVSSDPDVSVQPVSGGRAYRLVLSPRASLGMHNGHVSFAAPEKAGVERTILSMVSLPYQVEVQGRISVQPAFVVFGAVAAGREATQRVTVTGADPVALEGLGVTPAAPWLAASLTPTHGDAMKSTLDLQVLAAAPAGSHQTRVTLVTRDGQRLIIPVNVLVYQK